MKTYANFSVRFMPRALRNEKQNKEKIYARVTVNGQRVEISTSQNVTCGLFNPKAQRCPGNSKEARQVNDFLNLFTFKMNEIRQNLILSEYEVTAEALKRVYHGLPVVEEDPLPKVIEFYQEHNERMKSLIGIDITAATVERHVTSMKHVNDFIRMRFKKDDLDFSEVDYSFITDYEHYLKVVRKCNHNTTMKYIKNFGKIMRLAISEQIITFNPMDKFKVTYKTVHREVLNKEEIKLLIDLEIKDERLDRVRDLFVFCIYTGLAFIDLSKLRMNHIVKGKDGTRWIKSTRCKSDIAFMIPLLSIPSKIIEKYNDYPKRSIDGTVLPALTNQKYNSYLKELAIRTGINKNLTSHMGRHTFATTITLNEGVPLEIVSKMLGHSNTRTTQIYAKVLEKGIQDGMRKLMDDDLDAVAV